MAKKKKAYGWIFDKHGNKREVLPPTYANGKVAKKHTKTLTGAIPENVGYPGFAGSFK